MEQEISTKNTKAQIMVAYDELLLKVQNAKAEVPKKAQEEKQREEKINKSEKISDTGIVSEISTLKSKVGSSLEELESKLLEEFKKLEELREAILIEKENLKDIYSLTVTTDSLAAMLLAQKEEKEKFDAEVKVVRETFENEMNELKEKWRTEKEKHLNEEKETTETLKKTHKREEEEHQYRLKTDRQKEKDEYESKKAKLKKELEEKKATFEQEMSDRESNLKSAEQELMALRKNNEEFPSKLEKSLTDKEKEVAQRIKIQYDFESKLIAKQNEGELKLKEQTIVSLKEKIGEMQQVIKQLTDKANIAEVNVKDIAMKAIESSSKIQVFPAKKNEED